MSVFVMILPLYTPLLSGSQQQQQVVAETWFYPANFTDVKLPEAKITASDFNQTADSGIMVKPKHYVI